MNYNKITSPTKKKILLLISAGLAMGLKMHTISGHIKIIKAVKKEWRDINRQYLYRVLREFRENRLISFNEKADGEIEIKLTEQGKIKVLQFNIDNISIKKPKIWDKKWRVVIFDVPEKKRKARDALRDKLKELDFYEWQKSVFIHPYDCRNEIDFVIEFFQCRNFVRYAELLNPTNEAELKLRFDLV